MNTLYPIFLKSENIQILIVGGGNTGAEKISFLLKNSPHASVTLLSKSISEQIKLLAENYPQIILIEKEFEQKDLNGKQIVIAATADREINQLIYNAAKSSNILINVADTPELCDFYLGSIVTKGDLKIAISTNGKSPTLSKRIREFFEEVLPDNINDLILHLNEYRNTLKVSFKEKVDKLNDITASFLKDK